jgi:nucleolar protein 6
MENRGKNFKEHNFDLGPAQQLALDFDPHEKRSKKL